MKLLSRFLLAFSSALILDISTKMWAEQTLELYRPVPVMGQFFRFTLGYNYGVAFGLFSNAGPWPLIITGCVISGLIIWLGNGLRTGSLPPVAAWPVGLLLGGAIANFADRLSDNRVTDFLDVGWGTTRWPTFNLADSFILLGLFTLMVLTIETSSYQQNSLDESVK